MPVRNVLVGDARRHIEHDDAALAVDVVAITETTKLLLSSGVPHVELDSAQVLEPVRIAKGIIAGWLGAGFVLW